jgi:hypothetical protein
VDNVKYTQVAAKAVSLAELFEARFEQGLDGPVRFRVELSAPDGPSTAGGKQAMQHIKLIPADGAATIVIGSANTTRQVAEIRTFEHVAELFAQRYRGARLPIDVTRYRDLTQALASFFKAMKMTVTFAEAEGAPVGPPAPIAAAGGGGARALIIGLGVTVALLVLALAYIFIFVLR